MRPATFIWRALSQLRVERLLESSTRPTGWTILMGHEIPPGPSHWHLSDPRHIPVEVFKRQMELLLARGYEFVTLGQGMGLHRAGSPQTERSH